jgi:hypothetical protein
MQEMMLALVTLLGVAGVGRGDDGAIIEQLKARRVITSPGFTEELVVQVGDSCLDLDAVLSDLCELRQTLALHLYPPRLTDAQLRQVCAPPGLRDLFLSDHLVDDTRLKIVARARGLRRLDLTRATITDAGLAELDGMRCLKVLRLSGTAVSDAGLRYLEGMRDLKLLFLRGCPNVTEVGEAHLQKALPNCTIIR